VTARKKFNPHWPFPQFDEKGRQLLPVGWGKRPTRKQQQEAFIREAGEALL
jgi:hypothetical protein